MPAPKFVNAYATRTGAKVRVPEHYLTSPAFEGRYRLTPKARAKSRGKKSEPIEAPETATSITEPPAQGETDKGVTPDA